MKREFIMINSNSNNSKKIIEYFKLCRVQYHISKDVVSNSRKIIEKIREGYRKFIICGGDGAINKFVNEIMKLKEEIRKDISIGIIPSGRANDLASFMGIPSNFEKALDVALKGKTKRIDLIKVNDNYVVTGGGLGLPKEIIEEIEALSNIFIGRLLKKKIGEVIYLLYALKKFIFGYDGVKIKINNLKQYDKLMAIYLLNQPFLGKRFNLAPKANNNDGYFNVTMIKFVKSTLLNLRVLSLGIKGKLNKLPIVNEKQENRLIIKTDKEMYFMGDGELFDKNKIFNIKIVPKAIKIIC